MTGPDPATPPVTTDLEDPWERWGWLMGGIWLVFLAFPIVAALTADAAVVWRLLTVGVVVAFGVVYVRALRASDDCGDDPRRLTSGPLHLAAMVGLAVLMVPVAGLGALSSLPFLVATAMFVLPRVPAVVFGLAGVAIAVATVVVSGDPTTWWAPPITLLVGLSTGLVVFLDRRTQEQQRMRGELSLARERDRVARDVHDVLGHSLTVVTVKAELAGKLVDADPERAKTELAEIETLSRQALAEIRATVGGLRVAALTEELAAAERALTGSGIVAELPDDPSVVDPRHRTVVAWCLREAVTNVVRHSEAGTCRIELAENRLSVEDDGRGRRGQREGNGLRGLRERVVDAGGSLRLSDAAGDRGTRVEVEL